MYFVISDYTHRDVNFYIYKFPYYLQYVVSFVYIYSALMCK